MVVKGRHLVVKGRHLVVKARHLVVKGRHLVVKGRQRSSPASGGSMFLRQNSTRLTTQKQKFCI